MSAPPIVLVAIALNDLRDHLTKIERILQSDERTPPSVPPIAAKVERLTAFAEAVQRALKETGMNSIGAYHGQPWLWEAYQRALHRLEPGDTSFSESPDPSGGP